MRTATATILFLATLVASGAATARNAPPATHDDPHIVITDGSNVHNAGRVALHVTNWGEFGSWPLSGQPFSFAPSFRWPGPAGAEYLFAAGLWVGAIHNGVPAVSTATFEHELRPTPDPIDIIYHSQEGLSPGWRYPNPGANDDGDGQANEEVLNGRDDDGDGLVDEDYAAISDQMFSCEYFDNEPAAIQAFPNHNPLNIRVRQESYAWDESRFDDFIGIKFTIRNIGIDVLQDVYVGMFVDGDIGHRDTDLYWEDDAAGSYRFPVACTDLGPVNPRVGYMYDADGDDGATPGYISVQFVGHPIDPFGGLAPSEIGFTSFHIFNANQLFETGGDPTNDFERYEVMSDATTVRDRAIPNDYRMLISVGPFAELRPDNEIVVHVALAIGAGFDGMRYNSFNAVHAFKGEWYDADNDPLTGIAGRETRFIGPGENVIVDACATPPLVIPIVPRDEEVWLNLDCATEALYESSCAQDSTRTMTGVGGRETQENWYIMQDDVLPVLVQRFDAEAAGDHVRLLWDIFADEPVDGYRIYRSDDGAGMRPVTNVMLAKESTGYDDYAVVPGAAYEYLLAVVLPDDREIVSPPQRVTLDTPALDLEQNKPNPFNPTTTISFTAPARGAVTVDIFDAAGRHVRSLMNGIVPAGTTRLEWDGRDRNGRSVGSGVYFCRLTSMGGVRTRKMVLLK